jgi:WD40 repeat protein/serine/threonine protein kinase
MVVYDSYGKRVRLGKEMGRGGEAVIYRVQRQDGLLAKIYVPRPRPGYGHKLAWMKANPPEEPDYSIDIDEHKAIAWPLDLLYDRRHQLVGYLMPRIRGAVILLEVFNPRLRAQSLPFNWKYLHRTARNLTAALGALHARDYVVGDLNESNVLVTPEALVTLIDTDSFQVQAQVHGETVCYRCPVGKPEYTAPELQGRLLSEVTRKPEHDNFALGVLVFQLLLEGNHPFRSRWKRAGDPPSLAEKISSGLFPHVKPPPKPVAPPPNVPPLDTLHPAVVDLVLRCFVDGHNAPYLRPTAMEWRAGLEEAEAALVQCRKGHYYSSHLSKCPQCSVKRVAIPRPWVVFPPRAPRRPRRRAPARPQVVTPPRIPILQPSWWQQAFLGITRWKLTLGVFIALLVVIGLFTSVSDGVPAGLRSATATPTSVLQPRAPISTENVDQIVQLARLANMSYEAAWSPDGNHLALASDNLGIYLYDIPTLQRTQLGGHTAVCVSFSPDGTLLASCSKWDHKVRIWEVSSGHEIHVLSESHSVFDVAFSPDGTLLASGVGPTGTVTVWEVLSGRKVHTLSGHSTKVSSVTFSPDGALLASGSYDRTVRIWEVSSGHEVHTLPESSEVNDVAFSPDGTLLVSVSNSGSVKVWEVSSGLEVRRFEHPDTADSVAFSPDGTLLASGHFGVVRLWEVSSGLEVRRLGHSGTVYSVAFSPDGTLLVSTDIFLHNAVILWGVPTSSLSSPSAMSSTAAPDQTLGIIRGVVIDSGTGSPLSVVNVTTDPPSMSVATDVKGRFMIPDVPPGRYAVTATKLGYASGSVEITFVAGETATANIEVSPLATPTAAPTPIPTPTPTSTETLVKRCSKVLRKTNSSPKQAGVLRTFPI